MTCILTGQSGNRTNGCGWQVNFCQRHGLITEECVPDQISWRKWNQITDDMSDILRTMTSTRPRRRAIRFLEGQFDPTNLGRRRVFIAKRGGASEHIDSLLICNPSLNGNRWSFETYARRADSVRGSIPYLMQEVMLQLRAEGVESISLCLVPGHRCRAPLPGDNALVLGNGHRYGILPVHLRCARAAPLQKPLSATFRESLHRHKAEIFAEVGLVVCASLGSSRLVFPKRQEKRSAPPSKPGRPRGRRRSRRALACQGTGRIATQERMCA